MQNLGRQRDTEQVAPPITPRLCHAACIRNPRAIGTSCRCAPKLGVIVTERLIFALKDSPGYVSGALLSNEDLRGVSRDAVVLSLEGAAVDDAGIEHLPLLSALRCLDLDGTKITDRSLRYIACMPALEELWLECTAVTDTGLGALKSLRTLRFLSVAYTKVTDAGIAELHRAVPALEVSR